jgi:hypothetical protein
MIHGYGAEQSITMVVQVSIVLDIQLFDVTGKKVMTLPAVREFIIYAVHNQ